LKVKANKSPDPSVYQYYLRDLGMLIREYALEAKSKEKTDFDGGYIMCFHRVLTLMQQQAEGFGIPLSEIGLDGFDPDVDLFK